MTRTGERMIVWIVAVCTAGLSGLPVAMAQGCGDPESGSCFENNETPFCNDLECCEVVCAVDPFCCDTSWDETCAEEALMLCETPCGDPLTGDCFEPNGTPFCDNADCCEAVCAIDAFCCTVEWDEACVDTAFVNCQVNDRCEDAFSIENGETPFVTLNTGTDGPQPCGLLGSDVWYQYTAAFTGLATISTCGSGFDTVIAVYEACGCVFTPISNCCEDNGTPGCDDPDCEAAVCAEDAFCCDTSWDAICAEAAEDLCSPLCEIVESLIACNDDSCGLQSQVTIAVDAGHCYLIQIGGFNDAEGVGTLTIAKSQPNDACDDRLPIGNGETAFSNVAATTDGPDVCGSIGSDVWFNYIADFTGELTVSTCGSDFNTVLAAYAGCECDFAVTSDCCEANGTPGCDDLDCQETVCAKDPFCCETEWDGACAAAAGELCAPLCQAPTLLACNDDACDTQSEISMIVVAGQCYKLQVGGFEGAQGSGLITISKGPGCGSAAAGDCYEIHDTPFCNDLECCETVCADDPFCCEVEWDEFCADSAMTLCPCGNPEGGSCFEANGTPGCDDEECCEAVCAADPFCCNVEWDSLCVDNAWFICQSCGANDAGSCLEPNGTPSCFDLSCCATVCEIDPFCCETEWDAVCVDEAADLCCPGDINRDGQVNVDDLIGGVILGWGPCPVGLACPADLDGNRQVAVDDLITVIVNWGPCEEP